MNLSLISFVNERENEWTNGFVQKVVEEGKFIKHG